VYGNRTNDMASELKHWIGLALPLLAGASAMGQAGSPAQAPATDEARQQAPYGYAAPAREAYQGAWSTTSTRQEAELWRSLCAARPADVGAQLNWFRSERNARMATNNGRLTTADADALDHIATGIQRTAPGSFEHHLSMYYLRFPGPGAAEELRQAEALAPQRPELVLPLFNRANATGDKAALDAACARLENEGGLSPALLEVAADLLRSVDRRAVLFANGDMDAAPAIVQQRRHDIRRDVLVVDQRLLADGDYRERIWREAGASGPVPGSGPAFAQALRRAGPRPVFLALSLDRSWFDAFPGELCTTGIAFAVQPPGSCTMATLAERWAAMGRTSAAGPLSRNYLLPGAVLLQHYRNTPAGESQAAQLEHELRLLGTALGATRELIGTGILTH
jgi:hypothetical protein